MPVPSSRPPRVVLFVGVGLEETVTDAEMDAPVPSGARKAQWFPDYVPSEISDKFQEPGEVRKAREVALQAFLSLPAEKDPLYKKYAHLGSLDLSKMTPLGVGSPVLAPEPSSEEIVVIHDSSGTRVLRSPGVSPAAVEVWTREEMAKKGGEALTDFLSSGEPLVEKFRAMNLSLATHWTLVKVKDGYERPVRIREISVLTEENQALSVKRLILPGRRSRVFHIEEVYSHSPHPSPRLYSSSSTIRAGGDSEVIAWTNHSPDAQTVAFFDRYLTTAENAHVHWMFSGVDGSRTTLRNLSRLERRGAEVTDLEVFFADQDQSCASSVRILHDADDTRGQSITRGVFRDRARGTITGMMQIDPSVKKIYSYLSEHAMLLSKTARAETAPGMEIHSSNDVKASHSSSVAPLDPERLFYLESRGFTEALATREIVEGFLSSVLAKSPLDGTESVLSDLLDRRWGGTHTSWDGKGLTARLTPGTALWKASAEERFDEKLRTA